MENFIVLSLLSYGLFWFLNYSSLTEAIRKKLKVNEASTWYQRLYACPFCLGYHFGWFFLVGQNYGLLAFLLAFIVAVLTYFTHLIDKALIKYIHF